MEAFLNEYLSVLKLERNLSENTISSYGNDLTSLLNFLEKRKIDDLSQVNINHITTFFYSLNKHGLSSTTTARYFSSTKGVCKERQINKYIEESTLDRKLSTSINPLADIA